MVGCIVGSKDLVSAMEMLDSKLELDIWLSNTI